MYPPSPKKKKIYKYSAMVLYKRINIWFIFRVFRTNTNDNNYIISPTVFVTCQINNYKKTSITIGWVMSIRMTYCNWQLWKLDIENAISETETFRSSTSSWTCIIKIILLKSIRIILLYLFFFYAICLWLVLTVLITFSRNVFFFFHKEYVKKFQKKMISYKCDIMDVIKYFQ